jgi:hypothetical protein
MLCACVDAAETCETAMTRTYPRYQSSELSLIKHTGLSTMIPSKERRARVAALLYLLLLATGASGLTVFPISSRPVVSRRTTLLSRRSTRLSASVAATHFLKKPPSTKVTPKRQLTKSQQKAREEFQWLNWVYNQWRPTKAGELSEEVLKQMVPAISRWGRRKNMESAERAEELLERVVEENLAGNPRAELTVAMFNAAMNGFAKIGHPEGVQRILRRMETLQAGNDHLAHLKADVFSMSTLATSWAKSRSPEAATKALDILKYMDVQKLSPNTITYNAVLHALAMGNQIDKAVKAEDIVKQMEKRYADGEDCRPDIYSYQSLIQTWAKTSLPGSPQKAEQILRFLDQRWEDGDEGLSPNVYCFTSK